MEMDLYSACPCGSGKKIKFCCPREHVTDYLKVFELIEAEQFAAAAELTDRLVAKAPRQICFLALKATFLDPTDEAATREMAAQLQAVAPQHPITHAAQAVVALHNVDLNAAIEQIQDCIERLENAVPSLLLTAMSMAAGAALQEGKLLTAYAHGSYVLMLTKGRHTASSELIQHLQSDSSTPPVVLDSWLERLAYALGDKLDARLAGLVRRGKWRQARREAQAMLQRHPESVGAQGILALVEGSLGHDEAAQAGWQRLAESAELPDELAADAWLMTQCVSRDRSQMLLPLYHQEYKVTSSDTAMERLLSDRRAVASKEDLSELGDEENPPPKALFHLLSAAPLTTPQDVAPADLPRVLGQVLLFGKQTDREARLEMVVAADDRQPLKALLFEIVGDALAGDRNADAESERVETYLPLLPHALLPRLYHSEDLPPEEVMALHRSEFDRAIEQRFADWPNPLLEGKTPRACAGDPALRRRLIAALLWLETTSPFESWEGDWQALWSQYQLSRPLAWHAERGLAACGITQLVRVDFTTLPDGELLELFEIATGNGLRHALRGLAQEVTRRPSTRREVDVSPAFQLLVHTSGDPESRLKWIEQAVAWCRERSMPEGRWLVQQATWQIVSGKGEAGQETLNRVMTRHKSEPGVMQDVYHLLLNLGLITPDGRPVAAPAPEAAAAEAAGGRLWTPDQGAAPTATPQAASKLWVPGME